MSQRIRNPSLKDLQYDDYISSQVGYEWHRSQASVDIEAAKVAAKDAISLIERRLRETLAEIDSRGGGYECRMAAKRKRLGVNMTNDGTGRTNCTVLYLRARNDL